MKQTNRTIMVVFITLAIVSMIILGINYLLPKDDGLPQLPLPPTSFDTIPSNNITINLNIGWQMISMPNTMDKESIFINYDDDTYSWNNAVTNNLIADVIFEYNNGYLEVQQVLKTHGYWIYTFVDDIYLSDEAFVLYAGKLFFDGTEHIICDKLVIAPEYYTNDIHCASLIATNMYEFYYEGGEVLNG